MHLNLNVNASKKSFSQLKVILLDQIKYEGQ